MFLEMSAVSTEILLSLHEITEKHNLDFDKSWLLPVPKFQVSECSVFSLLRDQSLELTLLQNKY